MLYLEYHELSKKCRNAETDYYNTLDKRSKLISSVFPGAIKPKEIIAHSSTSPDAKIIAYASEIEEIDKLVNTSRNTMDMLKYELEQKEIKLKNSENPFDKIYYYCWLKSKKPSQIYRLVPCSRSSAYNYKDEIKVKLFELREKGKKK